ncbi:Glycosyltransferase involved in cell wall bisynthesis [bacterium JGI 053]|nr:Glycosyltransferase involved in cell wall bisynthesis [bacterium JGI 053]
MIYICIPALNEARTIGVLLWKIRQVMDEFPRDYHVLVLDDGSTDDTRQVLEPYLRVLPVSVLRNERTLGYAAALERLIREAANRSTHPKRDVVITLQADFTESPDDIPLLLKKLEGGADVVGVTVTATEGELPRGVRWSRRGLPWLLSRTRVPKELGDPLTGFRAYRVAVLRRALQDVEGRPLLTKHGWAANAELLLCVLPHVRRADGAEVSLRYTRRERPTRFKPWSTALELWDLARKAPKRLALARAASVAADARGAAAPAPPPAQPRQATGDAGADPAFRQRADPVRASTRPQRHPDRPSGTAPAAPPARQPRPERQAKPVQPTPPALVANASPDAAEAVESAPAGERRKRRRPPRRKSAAAKAAAAAQAGVVAEAAVGPAAEPTAAPADAPAPSAEPAGDGADAPKRPSRPRRPRRPRTPRSAEGGGEGPGGEAPGGAGPGGEAPGGEE